MFIVRRDSHPEHRVRPALVRVDAHVSGPVVGNRERWNHVDGAVEVRNQEGTRLRVMVDFELLPVAGFGRRLSLFARSPFRSLCRIGAVMDATDFVTALFGPLVAAWRERREFSYGFAGFF